MIRLPFSRQFFLPLIRQFCKPQIFFIILFIIIFFIQNKCSDTFCRHIHRCRLAVEAPYILSLKILRLYDDHIHSRSTKRTYHRLFPDSRAYCSCMRIKRTSGNCNMLRPYISAERSDDPVTVLCSCVGIFFYPRVLPDHMQNPSTDT